MAIQVTHRWHLFHPEKTDRWVWNYDRLPNGWMPVVLDDPAVCGLGQGTIYLAYAVAGDKSRRGQHAYTSFSVAKQAAVDLAMEQEEISPI